MSLSERVWIGGGSRAISAHPKATLSFGCGRGCMPSSHQHTGEKAGKVLCQQPRLSCTRINAHVEVRCACVCDDAGDRACDLRLRSFSKHLPTNRCSSMQQQCAHTHVCPLVGTHAGAQPPWETMGLLPSPPMWTQRHIGSLDSLETPGHTHRQTVTQRSL